MVQKMELLSQDLALLADPTDQELQTFFEERREDYRIDPLISFSHVYFNPDRRGDGAEDDARRVLESLRAAASPPVRAPERGDRFLLPHDFSSATLHQIQQQFGSTFADDLRDLAPGWHGPVVSGYGLHLVYVADRVEGRVPELSEVRDRVVLDFNRDRTTRAKDALYEGLRSQYEIVIDSTSR